MRALLPRRRTAGLGWCIAAAALLVATGCGDSNPVDPGDKSGLVAFIGISGAPDSGKAYVGQYVPLNAVAYGADHQAVSGVTITWTSSDPTKATVSDGLVLAKGEGSVIITASCGGKQATTQLTLLLVPVATVRVSPATGATYVGLKLRLTATARDSNGFVLPDRPMTWTSSNSSVATVDIAGEVTPVSPGSVTITASTQRVTAVANISILTRPVANWSGVTDQWLTFQGNASHTGYVPATADAVSFRPLWTSWVVPGVALNPIAIADGQVFVSTNAYFGTQTLSVLDAGTGAPRWTYDFGRIHSVDPPAYAAGTVYVQTGGHEDSYLWAFDATSGALRFRTNYGNQWSNYAAPVVDSQGVYAGGGYYGGMYAFNTADGSQRWVNDLGNYYTATPAVSNGLVYAYSGVKLTVADATTGVATYDILSTHGGCGCTVPALGALGNAVVTASGWLTSFDLQGRKIGWEVAGNFTGSVTVADGVLYVVNNAQVEAHRESDGSLLWLWVPPEGQPHAPMIATKNLLLVHTDANTYALDLSAHTQVWSYPAAGELAVSKDGVLFIAQNNGKLTAIAVK